MRNVVRKIGLLALALSVASGCARQTEVVKLYDEPAREPKTYQRLLVVDIFSDRGQQQEFENEIVDKLKRERVEAIASHTMLDPSEGLRQDEIKRASAEIGADAILVTHIASVDTKVALAEGREDIKWTCRGGDPLDYFLYEHEVIREPDSVKVAQTVIVISNLYDAGNQKRVWTIQSTCFDKATISEALLEEAIAIAWQLRIDQLIRTESNRRVRVQSACTISSGGPDYKTVVISQSHDNRWQIRRVPAIRENRKCHA